MTLFKNKYRVESHRLKGWNYASNGCYFLTFCTQNRVHWFGDIEHGKMVLSDMGKIVNEQWIKSFEIRDELFAGEFVVMPNHIHGIVVIDGITPVETNGRSSLPLKRKPKSISSFMAGVKSATVNKIDNYIDSNKLDIIKFNRKNRLWQGNYYDRIIRNEKEYESITEYIYTNPGNWENDKLYDLTEAEITIIEESVK